MKLKADLRTAVVSGIDTLDAPDFCDAFIESMEWENGTPMLDTELEQWEYDNQDAMYNLIINQLV